MEMSDSDLLASLPAAYYVGPAFDSMAIMARLAVAGGPARAVLKRL